jgi:hypothetical protein
MKFKCKFCEKLIPMRQYGADVIKCSCGAVYRKQHTIEVILEKEPK